MRLSSETRQSWLEFRDIWRRMTDDERSGFVGWLGGIIIMIAAIIIEFRWTGAMFVGGLAMWWASRAK